MVMSWVEMSSLGLCLVSVHLEKKKFPIKTWKLKLVNVKEVKYM
jgi:hypothetical protein